MNGNREVKADSFAAWLEEWRHHGRWQVTGGEVDMLLGEIDRLRQPEPSDLVVLADRLDDGFGGSTKASGEIECKRSGRKHETTWPDGTTSVGYSVLAFRHVDGHTSSWTAGFAAEGLAFGKKHWTIRHPITGEVLVSCADQDALRDGTLDAVLWGLMRKIERGDIVEAQP